MNITSYVQRAYRLFMEWGHANAVLTDCIVNGIIGGVGAVLGFVPQMFVLFLLLSIVEDCGYMVRIAFVMDRIFRRFGLSGKSFIPLLISSGCGVPGIMASKTIEHDSLLFGRPKSFVFKPNRIKISASNHQIGAFLDHELGVYFDRTPLAAACRNH